ncbi:MAG: nicotinate-nucleotide adenylyltransferase [Planctomycetota bacterium]
MRLGVFGGSFDPVHNGHLGLARRAIEHARLDAVWFVPAATQPHKPRGPVASNEDRLAMLRLALADEPRMEASSIEIDRGGVSYTVDTLREIAAQRPADELFFLMGADTLRDLPLWREPREVLALATPLVISRDGDPAPDFDTLASLSTAERLVAMRTMHVRSPPMAVSSSELRERTARGDAVADAISPHVEQWIRQRGLYGSESH